MILSQHPISTLSFIEDNVLAGGSNSVKSVSLWVGIDNIGSIEQIENWLIVQVVLSEVTSPFATRESRHQQINPRY